MPSFIQGGTDADIHRKPLPGPAFVYSANRRNISIVPAISNPHVPHAYRIAESRVKSRPALLRKHYFRPGMRSLSSYHFFLLRIGDAFVARNQVTRDIAGRQASHANHP